MRWVRKYVTPIIQSTDQDPSSSFPSSNPLPIAPAIPNTNGIGIASINGTGNASGGPRLVSANFKVPKWVLDDGKGTQEEEAASVARVADQEVVLQEVVLHEDQKVVLQEGQKVIPDLNPHPTPIPTDASIPTEARTLTDEPTLTDAPIPTDTPTPTPTDANTETNSNAHAHANTTINTEANTTTTIITNTTSATTHHDSMSDRPTDLDLAAQEGADGASLSSSLTVLPSIDIDLSVSKGEALQEHQLGVQEEQKVKEQEQEQKQEQGTGAGGDAGLGGVGEGEGEGAVGGEKMDTDMDLDTEMADD